MPLAEASKLRHRPSLERISSFEKAKLADSTKVKEDLDHARMELEQSLRRLPGGPAVGGAIGRHQGAKTHGGCEVDAKITQVAIIDPDQARAAVHFVSACRGGDGAIREAADLILAAREMAA